MDAGDEELDALIRGLLKECDELSDQKKVNRALARYGLVRLQQELRWRSGTNEQ